MKDRSTATISEPKQFLNSPISMIQFTHLDNDHCGQGAKLLSTVHTDKDLSRSFINTEVVYHRIPDLNPHFVIRPKR